jgi:hypothetical protein
LMPIQSSLWNISNYRSSDLAGGKIKYLLRCTTNHVM